MSDNPLTYAHRLLTEAADAVDAATGPGTGDTCYANPADDHHRYPPWRDPSHQAAGLSVIEAAPGTDRGSGGGES